MDLYHLYNKLISHYGPQGWWPLISWQEKGTNPTLRGRLTGYHCGVYDLPKEQNEIFEIMLGALLTQNTSWVNAEKALIELKKRNLIDQLKLNALDVKDLANYIRSSGYYNQKAIKIQSLLQFLNQNPITKLQRIEIRELRSLLLTVKGIGPETADSIILYALKKPIFVIDTYTRRLISRMGIASKDLKYEELQNLFHSQITPDLVVYNEFHALIVQHCVHVCNKKPDCKNCLLEEDCIKKIEIPKPKIKKSYSKNH